MGPTPFYGARAEKTQKADFAMKQTNVAYIYTSYVALAAT